MSTYRRGRIAMKVSRLVALCVAVTLLLGNVTVAPAAATEEILVKFAPGVDPHSFARAVGGVIRGKVNKLEIMVLRVPAGSMDATLRALQETPLVLFAEPNARAKTLAIPNDPMLAQQWAWTKMQAFDAWNVTTGLATVKVAVVDTGIDSSHPDLPAVAGGISFVSYTTSHDDDYGHGTHVAGIIGALTNNSTGVAGANWNVSLLSVKVLDNAGMGTADQVANGIIWAVQNGAKVINLSMGFPDATTLTTLQQAIKDATTAGVLVVCAAGNEGIDTVPMYPAAYPECLAVAASDSLDNRAVFSNFGAHVDVAAPGVDILSTMPDNQVTLTPFIGLSYGMISGTSMSAAFVSGLAALVLATGHCTAETCIRMAIENTVDAVPGAWVKGRVNYLKAVNEIPVVVGPPAPKPDKKKDKKKRDCERKKKGKDRKCKKDRHDDDDDDDDHDGDDDDDD